MYEYYREKLHVNHLSELKEKAKWNFLSEENVFSKKKTWIFKSFLFVFSEREVRN